MIVRIPKPKNEADFVNLYNNIVMLIREKDLDLHDYLLEANICDDCEFDEIIALLGDYYESVRGMRINIEATNEDFWDIGVV